MAAKQTMLWLLVWRALRLRFQRVGVVFAAHGGFCFAGADGGVANLSGARFRPGRFISGSAAFSRKPGNHSVVFAIRK